MNNLVQPSREPDYISIRSSAYYWFEELVYLGIESLGVIEVDPETHLLIVPENAFNRSACGRCSFCQSKKICEKRHFADHIQAAYKRWETAVIERSLQLSE